MKPPNLLYPPVLTKEIVSNSYKRDGSIVDYTRYPEREITDNFVIETDESDTLNPFIRIATMTYGMDGDAMTKPALALSINQTTEEVTLVYVNYEMNGVRNVQSMGSYSVQSTEYMRGDMTLANLVNLFNFIEEGYINISSNAEIYNDFDNVYFCFSNPSTGELYTISENIDSSFIRIEDK